MDTNEFSFSFGTKDGIRQLISNKIGLSYPGFIGECSEKTVGTTTGSIAVLRDKPVVLLSPYFFRQDYYKDVNSASAPIHNDKNEVLPKPTSRFYCMEKAKTGKEMFAQAIHNASSRREEPFIAINCGALPGELVESELFGYEEGSFTGALKGGKIGKIEAASGGTLFLDEIESMPLKDQIKLLRALSTGKVQKIGSTKEKCVDVRLISATKTDLLKKADEGLFREDLFFRISTFIIDLPPLRERKEDILLLTEEFIKKICRKYCLPDIQMDELFIQAIKAYHWRGNVRELEHAIERAIIMLGDGNTLLFEHLSPRIQNASRQNSVRELVQEAIELSEDTQGILALAEKMVIEHVLETVEGNVSAAAEKLGINRRTIYNKIQRKSELKVIR